MSNCKRWKAAVFLSTPSARRATDFLSTTYYTMVISIHALREEGDDVLNCHRQQEPAISIHALREEGDSQNLRCCQTGTKFLSTPSARRATRAYQG